MIYQIKGIKIHCKIKHPKSFTHNKLAKCTQVKHTVKTPDFFEMEEIFNDYISNHKKN